MYIVFVQSPESTYLDVSLRIFGKGSDLLVGEVIGDDGALDAVFR